MCSSDATVVSDCFPSSTSSAKNCWPTGINDWIFLFQVHSEAQSCPRTFWKLKCVRICEENRRLLLAFLYLRKIDTKADHKKRQADNNEFIRFQMVICMNTSGEFPELLKVKPQLIPSSKSEEQAYFWAKWRLFRLSSFKCFLQISWKKCLSVQLTIHCVGF